MKDEKKVTKAEEEAKKEVKAEENGVELTDEQMAQVSGGKTFDDAIDIVGFANRLSD